jgi:Rrf2 family cysteine metabolism transcriptional repressor
MKISVKIDYACRVMAELARLHGSGELAQIEKLARIEAVPATFLAQILGKLRTANLIVSRRGNLGGYVLARPPEEITLYDIMIAAEGEVLGLSGNFQGRTGPRLKKIWEEVRENFIEKTQEYTLAQFAAQRPAEMYHI